MSGVPWKVALESQFGAALDMLENAIEACPPATWDDAARPIQHRFWYVAYHTLFWLDFYLADSEDAFRPPPPFTLSELDPAGVYPDRTYSPEALLGYLKHGRARWRAVCGLLDEARAARPCGFRRREMSVLELLHYNLRHVQHHVGQLQLLLRDGGTRPPSWIGRGRRKR
jgi:hypothetical protein